MKTRSHLQQAGDPATNVYGATGRLCDPAQDLEERALAGSVASDDAEYLAFFHFEGDIPKRPELLACGRRRGSAPPATAFARGQAAKEGCRHQSNRFAKLRATSPITLME